MRLPVEGEQRAVLRDVSLALRPGEALGLVGESGSGKSMTARAVDRLLPPGAEVEGSIRFDGRDVMRARRAPSSGAYRGEVAMIFQDPRAHINPVRRIGDFMTEALRTNHGVPAAEARRSARSGCSDRSGIDDGERRLQQYPHELSGGLLQRVMIAAALLTEPRLLLADEPTTALDVTTQAEVMAILDDLRREFGLALLFITHDLELAAAVCDRTAVMYAGQIVEVRRSAAAARRPAAPLHRGLAAARPSIDATAAAPHGDPRPAAVGLRGARGRLRVRARCPHAQDRCRAGRCPRSPPGRRARRAASARASCAGSWRWRRMAEQRDAGRRAGPRGRRAAQDLRRPRSPSTTCRSPSRPAGRWRSSGSPARARPRSPR